MLKPMEWPRIGLLGAVGLAAGIALVLSGCVGAATGACATTNAITGTGTYCYDGWDSGECAYNNQQQVNGGDWAFYAGQTCSDIGL